MESENHYDFLFKFLLIGDSSVGKSSIFLRFTDDCFSETFSTTIGVDFKIRTLEVTGGKKAKIQIWDTAGQERFRAITHSYYRNADGIFICFDLTNPNSFENVDTWYQSVMKMAKGAKVIMIGNKNDLTEKRQVQYSTALQYAMSLGIDYVETSAKESCNIHKVFIMLATQLVEEHLAKAEKNYSGVVSTGPEASLTFKSKPVQSRDERPKCNFCS
ncbi:uncharacterized protein LOC134851731 [Symsagittifera roscoffensis]|uniref:uncharacterized protein LOC134851731 n=1 Tax=Symsagittifera roscoffensis TaxID=84072 RepID=UPI00307B7B47